MIDQPILMREVTGEWRMFYPEVVAQFFEEYWDAVEKMDNEPKKAEKIFRKIISACGNGHIDAVLHLGFLYNDMGKVIEGNALINKAHAIAIMAIPKNFDPETEKILWRQLDNRPFLRTYHAIGLEYMKEGLFENAIEKFEFVVKVNPGDNQGVRFLLPECLLQLGNYEDHLKLDRRSEDGDSIEYSYASVLSNFKLNQFEKAKSRLDHAKGRHPFVAEELMKEKHNFPHDEFAHLPIQPSGVPVGSRQEAYQYWLRTKNVWENEKGFIEFLKQQNS